MNGNIVVVVNDEPTQLAWIAGVLNADGLNVRPFASASEALEGMADKPPPALVITDLNMPEIDGWRFCQLLRSPEYVAFNDVPILAVSATFAGDEPARLSIESGSDDFLALPVSPAVLVKTARALIASRDARSRRQLLIVEDDEAISRLIRDAFEKAGWDSRTASGISAAQELFDKTEFDAAIIDYHLPDGPGDSLLDGIRKLQSDCICVMITGDSSPDLALKWMRQGAASYIKKPFSADYLVSVCARAMRERSLLRVENVLDKRTRELKEREERYLVLINNTSDFIYSLDLEGRHTAVNRSVCEALRLGPDEIIGKNHAELGFPEDIVRDWKELHEKVFTDKQPVMSETTVRMSDGGEHIYEIGLYPIFDNNGRVTGLWGVSRDITERKKLERDMRLIERKYRQLIELERRRLSADLHDTVCQQMAGVGFLCGNIMRSIGDKMPGVSDMTREIRKTIAESMDAIRGIARRLKPLSDEPDALASALSDLSAYIGRVFGKECRLRIESPVSFNNPNMAGELFLIAREAVLNHAKHSNGDMVAIELKENDDKYALVITGNGSYEKSPLKEVERLSGLDVMRLRTETIGAELSIEHVPGGDVRVTCRMPRR